MNILEHHQPIKGVQSPADIRVYARTAIHSSLIQRVEVCALRGPDKKDIVFAKETSLALLDINLNQITPTLTSLHTQPVFGTVRDMKVLHLTFLHNSSTDHLTDKHRDLEPSPRVPGDDVLIVVSDSGILSFITFEVPSDQKSVGDNSIKGKGKERRDDHGRDTYDLDDAVGWGRFITIHEISLSKPGLHNNEIELHSDVKSHYNEPGRLVIVDPLSRAIAVSAFQDTVKLLLLRSTHSRENFKPVADTAPLKIEGIIFHAAFLYPRDNELGRILFAMVVVNDMDKKVYVEIQQFWRYDTGAVTHGLQNMQTFVREAVPSETEIASLPLQVVALPQFPESFLLFTETDVYFVKPITISSEVKLKFTRQGLEKHLVTNFTSPKANAEGKQYIYASTASGSLLRMDIGKESSEPTLMIHDLGTTVKCCGGSVCVLGKKDNGEGEMDFVMVTGEGGDGGLFAIETASPFTFTLLSPCPSLAPITDFRTVRLHPGDHTDTIFALTGLNTGGCVRAVREGVGVEIVSELNGESFLGVTDMWSLKTSDGTCDAGLVMSFAEETKVMEFIENELDDTSESSGLELNQPTLCVGNLSGNVVQVHRQGIAVVKRNKEEGDRKKTWASSSPISIAAISETTVVCYVLGIAGESEAEIIMVDIDIDSERDVISFSETGRLSLDSIQLSFIRSIRLTDLGTVFILGTYSPTISPTIRFIISAPEGLRLVHEENLEQFSEKGINIPESAAVITDGQGRNFFLVGLREGTVVCFELTLDKSGKIILRNPVTHRLGALPIRLVTSENPASNLVALSDNMWRICFSNVGLKFNIVDFANGQEEQKTRQVAAVVPFFYPTELITSQLQDGYMLVARDCLYYAFLGRLREYRSRIICELTRTPQRILLLEKEKLLLVACVSSTVQFPGSDLSLVDLASGKICLKKSLDSYERVSGLIEWCINQTGYSARYICVGTAIHSATPIGDLHYTIANQGRIRIYKINYVTDMNGMIDYEMEQILEEIVHGNGGVTAIAAFGDNGLLVSAGKTLRVYHFDINFFSLIEDAHEIMRFNITSLESHGSNIVIGSQKDSASYYRYDCLNKRLEFQRSDERSRPTAHVLTLDDELSVAADKFGCIYGLSCDPASDTMNNNLGRVFSFHHPELVPRLRTARFHVSDEIIGWDGAQKDREERAIAVVGCTMLGGLVVFLRLASVATYDILKALQGVMEEWKGTRPLLGNLNGILRSYTAQEHNTVDGDMVAQFLRLRKYEQKEIVVRLLKRSDVFKDLWKKKFVQVERGNPHWEDLVESIRNDLEKLLSVLEI